MSVLKRSRSTGEVQLLEASLLQGSTRPRKQKQKKSQPRLNFKDFCLFSYEIKELHTNKLKVFLGERNIILEKKIHTGMYISSKVPYARHY